MSCCFVVDVECDGAERIGVGWAYGLFHCLIGDVFVVAAGVDFGGGGEDGFGQAIGFTEAGRQLDAADRSGLLVVLPSRSGEVAAHDALNGEHLRSLDEHTATVELMEIGV